MRKLVITLILVAAVIASVAAYFVSTTPKSAAGVRFPLSAAQRALIASVPAEADSFTIVPTAAALDGKLRANPITRAPLEEWESRQILPSPWMIGGADLVAWRVGKQTRYLVRLDAVRALVVRLVLLFRSDSGGTLLLDAPVGDKLPADEVARLVALTDGLPAGDALIVQRGSSRAFPPIARPAVTAVQITPTDVVLTSRAAHDSSQEPSATGTILKASIPKGALLTFAFTSPPRAIGDLNRLFGSKVSALLDAGGQVTLYDVDAGKLLPRPLGVISIPADDARRATVQAFLHNVAPAEILGVHARSSERDGRIILSFDNSLDRYLSDVMEPGSWPNARWAVRMDPKRIVPIIQQLKDDYGLRLAAPHLYQSVRDLDRWIGALQEAGSVEGVDSVNGGVEELKVRIAK